MSRRSSVFKRTLSSLIKLSSRREHMSPASAKRMRARKSVGCRTPLSVFLFFAGTRTDEVSLAEAARPETSLLHFALRRLIARQYSRVSLCLLSPARCESPLVLLVICAACVPTLRQPLSLNDKNKNNEDGVDRFDDDDDNGTNDNDDKR